MGAQILDGIRIRDEILKESKSRVEELAALGRPPGLTVILAGDDSASHIYVRNKIRACEELGIRSERLTPPATVTTEELVGIVEGLNRRDEIDGILVQMPLPAQVDAKRVLLAISPEKDVDGLHPMNVGNLVTNRPGPRSCTPAGMLELLKRYHIPIAGRRAVIVGRSDLVGKPMAFLLLHAHATVTMCHSKTTDLAGVCREADILVAAMGRPAMITADYIKPGATVLDVGINRIDDRERAAAIFARAPEKLAAFDKKGSVLVGDVHPVDVAECAGAYTPVPGGVGPLTIAMLMVNTIEAAVETPRMLKVGLTGGLATGKSFVGRAFAALGCHLINADDIGRDVMQPGGEAFEPIVREFGQEILAVDGSIDRKRLAAVVFSDPERLAALNRLVHPPVIREQDRLLEEIAAQDPGAIAVVEAAVMIEAGTDQRLDKVVLTVCREEQQVERAIQRGGLSRQEALARIRRQMPLEEKRKVASYVIDTSGTEEDTLRQVREVYNLLRSAA